MSDPPSPELEALAARLFAAGRAERPGPALGRRLALIDPRHARQHTPAERSMTSPASVSATLRSRLIRGAALAALVASGTGIVLSSQLDGDAVTISPELASSRSRSVLPAPAPQPITVAPVAGVVPKNAATDAASRSNVMPPAGRDTAAAAEPAGAAAGARARHQNHPNTERTAPPAPRAVARPAPPRVSEPEVPPPVTAQGASSSAPPSTSPQQPLTLLGELDLLKRARAALRSGQPRNAIALLEAHGRERGGSELIAEATLLRVEATAALGERTVASDLATRFVRENPHSALSDRAKSFILVGAPQAP